MTIIKKQSFLHLETPYENLPKLMQLFQNIVRM